MKRIYIASSILLLAACSDPTVVTIHPEGRTSYPDSKNPEVYTVAKNITPPDSAYGNPGDMERLLDSSTEIFTMNLGSKNSLAEISRKVMRDRPTRAELNCSRKEALCAETKSMLQGQGVPVKYGEDKDNITLVYERLVARDCDSRYVDQSNNPHNLHNQAFGCSVVANSLQMISDKRQITDPSLMDMQDGEKAVQNYRRYKSPPEKAQPSKSFLKTITTE